MQEKIRWMAVMLASLLCGMWFGVAAEHAQEPAAPVFAAAEEDSLFETETPAPDNGFSIEVITPQATPEPMRVLIYHTHTYEAYEQVENDRYRETEKWRTADHAHNVVRVGDELCALLRALGIDAVHDTSDFEPPVLSSAYGRSLQMLEKRLLDGERYDLYIDLHRDAFIASYGGSNTVSVGGAQAARLMMLVGKGEGQTGEGFDQKPDWEGNLAIAQRITEALNAQAKGLCREVAVKSGRYNQHVAPGCILIEAGNNRNTLQEVLAAMPYLADAVLEALQTVPEM